MATGGERSSASGRSGGSGGHGAGRPGPATLGLDALLEVQRRGLQAAGELVDRLVRAVDGPDAGTGGDATPADPPGDGPPSTSEDAGGEPLDQLARAWADWVRRGLSVLDAANGDGTAAAPPGGATASAAGPDVALAAEDTVGVVRLVARPDRARGAAATVVPVTGSIEVWLHNRGARDRTAVTLHGGPLLGGGGALLPAGAVRLSPAVVDLPARSSRGITVAVRTEALPGTYRGVIVASGDPAAWIALEVAVTDHDGGDLHAGHGDGDDGR